MLELGVIRAAEVARALDSIVETAGSCTHVQASDTGHFDERAGVLKAVDYRKHWPFTVCPADWAVNHSVGSNNKEWVSPW